MLTGGQFWRRKLICGQLSEIRCQESQLHNVVSGKYFVTPEHRFAASVLLSMLLMFHIHYCTRYEEVNISLASVGIILQTPPGGVSDLTFRNKDFIVGCLVMFSDPTNSLICLNFEPNPTRSLRSFSSICGGSSSSSISSSSSCSSTVQLATCTPWRHGGKLRYSCMYP